MQHLTDALMCVMLACIDKPFLSGEIHLIISKLSFEKLPEDYSL